MKHTLRKIILFVALVPLLLSCIKENLSYGGYVEEGLPVTVTLGTRGVGSVQYHQDDYTLSSLRIMGYHTATGRLAFNKLITSSEFTETGTGTDAVKRQAEVEIITGDFTIVFIGNEASDGTIAAKLSGDAHVNTLTKLKELSFQHTAIEAGKEIPMFACYEQVRVIDDNSLDIAGTPVTGIWPVKLDRLAVRLDITLTLTAKQYQWWNAVTGGRKNVLTLLDVPQQVYLFENSDNSTNREDQNYLAAAGAAGYPNAPGLIEGPDAGGNYTVSFPRILLPELYFTDKQNDSKAVRIRIYLHKDNTDIVCEGKIGYETTDPAHYDYTLPRNHYFDIKSRIEENTAELNLAIGVKSWEDGDVDDMIGDRELKVSAVEAIINEHNMARIWFWTNQKDVSVSEHTTDGEKVDDIFYGLTGSGADNFHFNSSTGEGWFDIMTDRDKPAVSAGNKTYGLLLDAGGHQRKITVEVTIPSTTFAAYNYVGAFWRHDQTGERVIAGANTGTWSATVSGNPGWVILAPGKSLDQNLWVEGKEPGDAENFPVEGNATTVSGTGNIYFRIGLTGKNTTGANRYGKVTVVTGNGSYDIYIRQGEDADYIMRPGTLDPGTTITNRTLVAKYSPYNLTAAEYKGTTNPLGPIQLPQRSTLVVGGGGTGGGVFTDYPSQAGAFFTWAAESGAERYAYNPVLNPNISGNYAQGYWTNSGGSANLATIHETCPPGYRRPTDGSTSASTISEIVDSEQRQSLWLNPPIGTNNDLSNSDWGYYADGFFDRRTITDSASGVINCAVEANTSTVGYMGRLFYNPNTNASLFIPASGVIYSSLSNLGLIGNYWTASANSSGGGWCLYVYLTSGKQSSYVRSYSFSIRCVQE